MIKTGIVRFGKKKVKLAMFAAAFMMLPITISYASQSAVFADGGSVLEAKTADNVLDATLGRVEFWEWKRVDDASDIGTDEWKPVMMASGKTISQYNTNHAFLASATNRSYCYLPKGNWASTTTYYLDEVPGDPANDVGGSYGYYGKYENEAHSPSYYFNASTSFYYHLTSAGYSGITDEQFNSKRFFTTGSSMGVPWMKVTAYASSTDHGRNMVSICFPQKILSGGEAATFQPTSNDYYTFVRALKDGSRSEPSLSVTNESGMDSRTQDNWHLVVGKKSVWGGGIPCGSDLSTRLNNIDYDAVWWYLIGYNDDYANETCFDSFGSNIKNNQTDYCYLTMHRETDIEIIAEGSKTDSLYRKTTDYYYRPFIGKSHLFTSIPSQKVPDGKLFPMTAGTYIPAENAGDDNQAAATEGIIIPKGETLTIDGGTVSVSCKLINNGRIVIKNGGTLLVKSGGVIMPYTNQCEGQGTIECNGGNVIIMEGGKIYGFNNTNYIMAEKKPTSPATNPYNITNAPLRLTGGSTLINYGELTLTYGVIDNGSKIENRKSGKIRVGYNRTDALELDHTLSNYLMKDTESNYKSGEATIGIVSITDDSKGLILNEKTATIDGKDLVSVDIETPKY